ncbi:MAG: glycoside hydrolase family 1 protein [Pontiellaceae bacterium]|nr:glycoside hydrolase family 1 protein [Pontiellaceae bacterium]MBN2784057.1 glycoside hydrolase family 1 protein [Pontiellaceae bacterium]
MQHGFLKFPSGFLWGSAVSGHQIEGTNRHSDWWHWELATPAQPESGKAIDYWNRFEEDHQLLADLGHQAFRIGIEWARLEPRKGEFDREAVEHYRRMLESLKKHGIKICLTLHHWVLPKWVADQNDWLNPDTVEQFLRYVEFIIAELGEFPDLWITLNEPMVALLAGNISRDFPPQRRSLRAFRRAACNMLRAHAGAYGLIHQHNAGACVGMAMAYPFFEPWGSRGLCGWYERQAKRFLDRLFYQAWDESARRGKLHWFFGGGEIEGLCDSIDFCGVNYYFRLSLCCSRKHWKTGFLRLDAVPDGVEVSDMDWQIWPSGLEAILQEVWGRFGKPIYITENGIADASDAKRPEYIASHLAAVHAALASGVDVRGYFHWSFIDNFEWKEGFAPRFGLVAVDYEDPALPRTPRPSAALYSRIIRDNGLTS